ncbi:hypothetical protein HNR74_001412 [Flammeovirga kamogawensis]|nr:hypothetical protein [Flammeovirga kamogawensis]
MHNIVIHGYGRNYDCLISQRITTLKTNYSKLSTVVIPCFLKFNL